MNIKWKSTIKKLILKTMNEITSQKKCWLFYKWGCDDLYWLWLVNVSKGLEENWRILVSKLPEKINLKDIKRNELFVALAVFFLLISTDYKNVWVSRRNRDKLNFMISQAKLNFALILNNGLENVLLLLLFRKSLTYQLFIYLFQLFFLLKLATSLLLSLFFLVFILFLLLFCTCDFTYMNDWLVFLPNQ